MRDKNGIINERRAGKSSGFGSSLRRRKRRRRGHVLVNAFSRQARSEGRGLRAARVFICCGQPARRAVGKVNSNAGEEDALVTDSMNNYNDVNNLDPRKGEEVSGKSFSIAWPSKNGDIDEVSELDQAGKDTP